MMTRMMTRSQASLSLLINLAVVIMMIAVLLLNQVSTVDGYKWRLKDRVEYKKVLVFSEHYMFASHKGPSMLEEGSSRVVVDVIFTAM